MDYLIKPPSEIEVYEAALCCFGKEAQTVVCLEELGELLQAICKVVRVCPDWEHLDKLAEEIADVEIMLGQMRLAFEISERVEKWKAMKLKRLQDRIREAKEAEMG